VNVSDILMVEDDPGIRTLMRKLLDTVGAYRMHEAATAHEAIDLLHRQRVDLILLDVVLAHNSTGYCFMSMLSQQIKIGALPDVPVLLVSGLPLRELEGLKHTYPAIIRAMFCKPFDIDEFRGAVADYLNPAVSDRQPRINAGQSRLSAGQMSIPRPPVSVS
jgi:CheY-like chemotaxis protein